jgi:hypothetical protein
LNIPASLIKTIAGMLFIGIGESEGDWLIGSDVTGSDVVLFTGEVGVVVTGLDVLLFVVDMGDGVFGLDVVSLMGVMGAVVTGLDVVSLAKVMGDEVIGLIVQLSCISSGIIDRGVMVSLGAGVMGG